MSARPARPAARIARRAAVMPPPELADRTTDASTVTIPALPSTTSHRTILRRTGWLTTDSASLVVNPTPKNAERAWNRATSRDSPVCSSAAVPTRVMISETVTVTRTAMKAATPLLMPANGAPDIAQDGVQLMLHVVPREAQGDPA